MALGVLLRPSRFPLTSPLVSKSLAHTKPGCVLLLHLTFRLLCSVFRAQNIGEIWLHSGVNKTQHKIYLDQEMTWSLVSEWTQSPEWQSCVRPPTQTPPLLALMLFEKKLCNASSVQLVWKWSQLTDVAASTCAAEGRDKRHFCAFSSWEQVGCNLPHWRGCCSTEGIKTKC